MSHPFRGQAGASRQTKSRAMISKGGGANPFDGGSRFKHLDKDGEVGSFNGHTKKYEAGRAFGGRAKPSANGFARGGRTKKGATNIVINIPHHQQPPALPAGGMPPSPTTPPPVGAPGMPPGLPPGGSPNPIAQQALAGIAGGGGGLGPMAAGRGPFAKGGRARGGMTDKSLSRLRRRQGDEAEKQLDKEWEGHGKDNAEWRGKLEDADRRLNRETDWYRAHGGRASQTQRWTDENRHLLRQSKAKAPHDQDHTGMAHGGAAPDKSVGSDIKHWQNYAHRRQDLDLAEEPEKLPIDGHARGGRAHKSVGGEIRGGMKHGGHAKHKVGGGPTGTGTGDIGNNLSDMERYSDEHPGAFNQRVSAPMGDDTAQKRGGRTKRARGGRAFTGGAETGMGRLEKAHRGFR